MNRAFERAQALASHLRNGIKRPLARKAKDSGELFIYEPIGTGWFGGIGAKDVVAALEELPALSSAVRELEVRQQQYELALVQLELARRLVNIGAASRRE